MLIRVIKGAYVGAVCALCALGGADVMVGMKASDISTSGETLDVRVTSQGSLVWCEAGQHFTPQAAHDVATGSSPAHGLDNTPDNRPDNMTDTEKMDRQDRFSSCSCHLTVPPCTDLEVRAHYVPSGELQPPEEDAPPLPMGSAEESPVSVQEEGSWWQRLRARFHHSSVMSYCLPWNPGPSEAQEVYRRRAPAAVGEEERLPGLGEGEGLSSRLSLIVVTHTGAPEETSLTAAPQASTAPYHADDELSSSSEEETLLFGERASSIPDADEEMPADQEDVLPQTALPKAEETVFAELRRVSSGSTSDTSEEVEVGEGAADFMRKKRLSDQGMDMEIALPSSAGDTQSVSQDKIETQAGSKVQGEAPDSH